MVGSMNLPSVTELFLAQPPIYFIFDYGEGRADAAGNGSSAFSEAVRCPFETGGRGCVDSEEGEGEPGGDGGRAPPLGGGFSR
jgi:hypothetical protein